MSKSLATRLAGRDGLTTLALLALGLGARAWLGPAAAPTYASDEYYMALFAEELAWGLAGHDSAAARAVAEGARVFFLLPAAALSVLLQVDVLEAGRLVQLACSALSIPALYLAARAAGSSKPVASLAGVFLMVTPVSIGATHRYWADSQLTYLCVLSLGLASMGARRHRVALGFTLVLAIGGAILTKEYATPGIIAACALAIVLLAPRLHWNVVVLFSLPLLCVPVIVLAVLIEPRLADFTRPVTQTLHEAIALIPVWLASLHLLAKFMVILAADLDTGALGPLVVIGALLGTSLMVVASVAAAAGDLRQLLSVRGLAVGWIAVVSAALWVCGLAMLTLIAGRALPQSAFTAPALGLLALAAGLVTWKSWRGPAFLRLPIGLLPHLVFVLLVVGARFLNWQDFITSGESGRRYLAAVPSLALVAAVGIWTCTAALAAALSAALGRRAWMARAGVFSAVGVAVLGVGLVTTVPRFASASSSAPTSRLDVLGRAEPWLKTNLSSDDTVVTRTPRELAWHAGLRYQGYIKMPYFGGNDAVGDPHSAVRRRIENGSPGEYVAEFTTRPSKAWLNDYYWLLTRPYLQEVFHLEDESGAPVLYVFRHSEQPAGLTAEQRALELARSPAYLRVKENVAVRLTHTDQDSLAPSGTWSGEKYGLAWQDRRDAASRIYFALLSGTGSVEAEIPVSAPGQSAENASVAWDGEAFAVAFDGRVGDGKTQVFLARISASGVLLLPQHRLSQADGPDWEWLSPSIVWTGREFGLAYEQRVNGRNLQVALARLDKQGQLLQPILAVSGASGQSRRPQLIWTGRDYTLAWQEETEGRKAIGFARVDADGVRLEASQVRGIDEAEFPNLVRVSQGYGLAWVDARDQRAKFQFLNDEGAPSGDRVAFSTANAITWRPSLRASEGGVALAWSQGSANRPQVFATRIDRGVAPGEPLLVTPDLGPGALYPVLLERPGGFGVAWSDRTWGWTEIAFARLDRTTALVPRPLDP